MNDKIIEKSTKGTLNQKKFYCSVNPNLNFNYVLLYIKSINKYLCWKRPEDKIRKIYQALQKQVIENQTDGISSFIKGKEFSAWGGEKVYIISESKINEFKDRLLKDDVEFI